MPGADGLQLRVSNSEYMRQIGTLDSKISTLDGILAEYEVLKNQATDVLGDDDDNLEKLRRGLDTNIKAVQGQRKLLQEQRDLLQKQMDEMGMLKSDVQSMFEQAGQTAKSAFNAIKAVSDLTS